MKVKDDPSITGRWDEYNTFLLEEWDVLYSHTDGDYQGSCAFIAKEPNSWGQQYVMVDWSWGSCSGCDGYEELGEGDRIAAFLKQRTYYKADTLAKWLEAYEDTNRVALTEQYNDPSKAYVFPEGALIQVNAIRAELDMPAYHPPKGGK